MDQDDLNRAGPSSSTSQQGQSQSQGQTGNRKPSKNQMSRHRKVFVLFASITMLFVLSHVLFALKAIFKIDVPLHLIYFVNHVGNPLIYFAHNKQFRKDVGVIAKKLKCA